MDVQEELKALKQRIAELEEQVEQTKEFPQKYDDYWYVDADTEVLSKKWYNSEYDEGRLSIDNIFKTKDQAEFTAEKLRVEAELRKYSRPFVWGEENWTLYMSAYRNIFLGYENDEVCQGVIYFGSEDKALEAIETVGAERIKRYIFRVED